MSQTDRPDHPGPTEPIMPLGSALVLAPSEHAWARGVFGLDHPYLLDAWTPLLGPTSVLLLRQVGERWEQTAPAIVNPVELSRSLGLGAGVGANSRLAATLQRLGRFGFSARLAPDTVAIARTVPLLSGHQLSGVPAWVRERHDRHVAHVSAALEAGEPPPLGRHAPGDFEPALAARLRALACRPGRPGLSL